MRYSGERGVKRGKGEKPKTAAGGQPVDGGLFWIAMALTQHGKTLVCMLVLGDTMPNTGPQV
jgi:hypothetical protein